MKDRPVLARMSELAAQYPRYGYRRIAIFLGRDGHAMSFGRAHRLFDWCANGQQLKCLTVTDEWTKEGLAIEVDGRIRSGRVIEVLSRLVSERGAPLYLRSDNVLRQEQRHFGGQQVSVH